MNNPDVCPTCGHALGRGVGAGKRFCSLCGLRMKKRDKWRFGADGRPQHKDCSQPTGAPPIEALTLELK